MTDWRCGSWVWPVECRYLCFVFIHHWLPLKCALYRWSANQNSSLWNSNVEWLRTRPLFLVQCPLMKTSHQGIEIQPLSLTLSGSVSWTMHQAGECANAIISLWEAKLTHWSSSKEMKNSSWNFLLKCAILRCFFFWKLCTSQGKGTLSRSYKVSPLCVQMFLAGKCKTSEQGFCELLYRD